MPKKKGKPTRSPSDLQGIANMMSGDSNSHEKSKESNTRKSKVKTQDRKIPSPRKLVDDFQESPLKKKYSSDDEVKVKSNRILQLKLTVRIGKNTGSVPQLLLNANDMRKSEIRSGSSVCIGYIANEPSVMVATVWPSADTKAGSGTLVGPTAQIYNEWLQNHLLLSSITGEDNKEDGMKLSNTFSCLNLNESSSTLSPSSSSSSSSSSSNPSTPVKSDSSNSSIDKLPHSSSKKEQGFVFSKSEFSPSWSPEKINSSNSKEELNNKVSENSYYVFSIENALDIVVRKQFIHHSASSLSPNKLSTKYQKYTKEAEEEENELIKEGKELRSCFTFKSRHPAQNRLSGGVLNAHHIKVYQLDSALSKNRHSILSVAVLIRSALRSSIVPLLWSKTQISSSPLVGFISVMAKGEIWNLAIEFIDQIFDKDDDDKDEEDEDEKLISLYRITLQTVIDISEEDHVEKKKNTMIENSVNVANETREDVCNVWDDVGGLKAQIKQLREAIELPLTHPEVFDRFGVLPPRGVLLVGPPGTGKTTIARTFAKSANITMHVINGAEITSRYAGEGEDSLRKAFAVAEGLGGSEQKGKLLFIDEIDALAPAVASLSSESDRRLVATLLALMDGLDSSDNQPSDQKGIGVKEVRLMVLAATNRPFTLEPALRRPGRFDLEIEIGIPDAFSRRDILKVLFKKLPFSYKPHGDGDSLENVLGILAEHSHGFVGADLQLLCSEAILAAVRRQFLLTSQSNDKGSEGGTMMVERSDLLEGLKKVKPSALREVSVEVPSVRWSDIGGQEAPKQSLKEMVDWPLRYPQAFQRLGVRPPSGVLLYGPPGCSKTLIAKALATESKMNFIAVQGPELLSKWLGESERALATVFKRARAAAPSIVFFDEIDSIGAKRGSNSDSQTSERLLTQLLVELDGAIHGAKNRVVVVAATNRPDLLDDALLRPGRLDRHVYISPPNFTARCDILKLSLAKTPHTLHQEIIPSTDISSLDCLDNRSHTKDRDKSMEKDVFEENVRRLAKLSDGLSGAEMVALVRDAALRAIGDDLEQNFLGNNQHTEREVDGCGSELRVSADHLTQAASAAVKGKRITPSMIQFYEKFANKGK